MNKTETRSFVAKTIQEMAEFAKGGAKTFAEMTVAVIALINGEVGSLRKDVEAIRCELRKIEETLERRQEENGE